MVAVLVVVQKVCVNADEVDSVNALKTWQYNFVACNSIYYVSIAVKYRKNQKKNTKRGRKIRNQRWTVWD